MNVFSANRSPVALSDLLARGGEAAVYRVRRRDTVVAKVYARPDSEAQAKLQFMQANPPADPTRAIGHASIAWPQELLFDAQGRFAGYLMPFIQGAAPIVEVFNPRRRAAVMPDFNPAYLHRTARNLASALAALHARGYVVGDLNERNLLVTPRALVTLIDCDSFQVEQRDGGRIVTYPCPVGRLEYTPPELQGQAFRDIRRQPEHDAFGLAVLIFQLLMSGSHPFRGAWLGPDEPPSIETKIARGWFPWAEIGVDAIAPPANAPDLGLLHPDLVDGFIGAFVDGHARPGSRPTAQEWADALATAEAHLVVCRGGHVFADHVRRCPACGQRKDRPAVPDAPAGKAAGTRSNGRAAALSGDRSGTVSGWLARTLGGLGRPGRGPAGAHPPRSAAAHATATRSTTAVTASPTVTAHPSRSPATAPTRSYPQRSPAPSRSPTTSATASRTAGAAARNAPAIGATVPAGAGNAAANFTPTTSAGMSVHPLRMRLLWTGGLAIAAATVAVGAGPVWAALVDPSRAWLGAVATGIGASPRDVGAAMIGGLALALVGTFHSAADAPAEWWSQAVLSEAGGRAVTTLAGWLGGWWLAAAAFAALGLVGASAGATGAGLPGPGAAAGGDAVGWILGWSIYGAITGMLGERLAVAPKGRMGVGVVFGVVGWLAARGAGALGG